MFVAPTAQSHTDGVRSVSKIATVQSKGLDDRLRSELKLLGIPVNAKQDFSDFTHREDDFVCTELHFQQSEYSSSIDANEESRVRVLHELSPLIGYEPKLQALREADSDLRKIYERISKNKVIVFLYISSESS